MSEAHVLEKLLLYLDEDLPANEMEQIRKHLSACVDCSKQLELLATVWRSEQSKERVTPSPFLWTRIQARIEEYEKTPGFGWDIGEVFKQIFARPVTAFGVVVAIVAGIYLGMPSGTHSIRNSQATIVSSIADEFQLDQFDLVPPGTVGSAMVSLSQTESKEIK